MSGGASASCTLPQRSAREPSPLISPLSVPLSKSVPVRPRPNCLLRACACISASPSDHSHLCFYYSSPVLHRDAWDSGWLLCLCRARPPSALPLRSAFSHTSHTFLLLYPSATSSCVHVPPRLLKIYRPTGLRPNPHASPSIGHLRRNVHTCTFSHRPMARYTLRPDLPPTFLVAVLDCHDTALRTHGPSERRLSAQRLARLLSIHRRGHLRLCASVGCHLRGWEARPANAD
ncbi:hypothetical protein BV20DRAFT_115537 [Pilatotrama ljubarskyi]|nr:hypothetical protein BV20DRAFT_115537 [Pilatotrama ljubarskyi]